MRSPRDAAECPAFIGERSSAHAHFTIDESSFRCAAAGGPLRYVDNGLTTDTMLKVKKNSQG